MVSEHRHEAAAHQGGTKDETNNACRSDATCQKSFRPWDACPRDWSLCNSDADNQRGQCPGAALKDETAKLGVPKIEGSDTVGGKNAPALYFGSTKINNNLTVVDEVVKEGGEGMAATLFVKGGDECIRVATNVPNPDGSGRLVVERLVDGPQSI
jgi:hypothetical protein